MNLPYQDGDPVLAAPRRLDVPRREDLLREYGRTERMGKVILVVEILVAIGWLALGLFRGLPTPSWPAWLALGIGALGVFRFIPRRVFLNKVRLQDIRPDARLGDHTRDSLVRLTGDVFARLGLPPDAAPVYLIREKDVNAHAVRCELWPGRRAFNGVFLNRGLLHLLDERELACVIGHELGHVFPYSPLLSRCYLVHALAAGMTSFGLTWMFPNPAVALMAPLGIVWLLDRVVALPHIRLSRGVEFLCDDVGVRAGGLLAALSGEMKLAAENETRQALMLRVLEARERGAKVSMDELFEAYESAVPFGRADPAAFEREFGQRVARQERDAGAISLRGFLESLSGDGGSSADASLKEEIERLRMVLALPVLPIDRARFLGGSGHWTESLAARLVAVIRADPHRVLFRLPDEIGDRESTHPSPSRRMLFLSNHWQA